MTTLLSIRQASERTQLSASTLRYYERIGLIAPIQRDDNDYRQYNEADIEWIEFVKCMQKTGMPLAELRQFSDLHREQGDLEQRLHIIQKHLKRVHEQYIQLGETQEFLQKKVKRFQQAIQARKDKG